MPIPTTDVQLCSLGLSLVSNEAITDITAPKSKLEITCAKWYQTTLRQVLALHPWNFAKARFLCPQETAPLFGYSHSFTLPSDYLRLIFIGKSRQDFVTYYSDFSVEGQSILLNYDTTGALPMQYTKYETRVGTYAPWFIDVFMYAFARNISPELNRTTSEIETMNNLFLQSLSVAKQLEGQESLPITVTNSKYLTGQNSNIRFNVDNT